MSTFSPMVRSRFGIRFSIIARRWRRELEAALVEAGLSDATWSPLVHLDETGGGISQKQLAALVGVDASTLVRLIDILEGRGWVARRPDPQDGRARLIDLTPAGREEVRKIRELLMRSEEDMLSSLSDDEVESMMVLLDRIDEQLTCRQLLRSGGSK